MKCLLVRSLAAVLAALSLTLTSVAAEGTDPQNASASDAEQAAVRAAVAHIRRLKLERIGDDKKTIGLIERQRATATVI